MIPVTLEYRIRDYKGDIVGEPRIFSALPFATEPCIGWNLVFNVKDGTRYRRLSGKVIGVTMTAGEETVRVVVEYIQPAPAPSVNQ